MITQQRLKELLSYDRVTGVFTWRVNRGGGSRKGDVAGAINGGGYVDIEIGGKSHRAHRLAFLYILGYLPNKHVDHINGRTTDNRWENLRAVSRSENAKNQARSKNNTSGILGVYFNKRSKKWHATIWVAGKSKWLGYFDSLDEAANARKQAEIEFGFHANHGREAAS